MFFSELTFTSTWTFLVAQMVKNLPAMQETWAWSLGQEDPLEKGLVPHSSILVWRIPWTQEPGESQSVGLQRVGLNCKINTLIFNILETYILLFCNGINYAKEIHREFYFMYTSAVAKLNKLVCFKKFEVSYLKGRILLCSAQKITWVKNPL